MCDGCIEIILEKRHVVRHAALCNLTSYLRKGILQASNLNTNDFVKVDDLISIILKKTFIWKKNQTGEINLNNKFFHTIARNAAIDEVGTYHESLENLNENEVMSDSRHLQIIENIHLNIEKKQKLQLIHNACENDMERDAIYSLSIGEDTQSFADRHGLEYNTATQFKRRLKEKLKNRLNINSDQSTSNQENNHG